MSYDILLFDADATLFDFEKAEEIAFYQVAEQNKVIPNDEVFQTYKRINIQNWKDFEKGIITKDQLMIRRFSQFLEAINNTESDPVKFDKDYLYALSEQSILFDYALELVKNLYEKGKRIFLITNGVTLVQVNRLNKSAIKNYIEDVFISEQMGSKKPEREYFEKVKKSIKNFDESKAIVIGDSLTSDIQGAMNANLPCIWLNLKDEKAIENYKITYEAHSLKEVENILLNN